MALSGVFMNIILNFILIPKFFAIGAAYSSFITQTIAAGIQIYMAYKIFKLKLNFDLLLKIILFVFITFISAYLLKYYTDLQWILKVICIGSISLICMIATGMLNLNSALKLLKSE